MTHLHGYTLFEMIMTFALISILSIIAVPSWQYFQTKIQSDIIIKRLIITLQFARNSAIALHTIVRICPSNKSLQCDNSWDTGWMIYSASDNRAYTPINILKIFPAIEIGKLQWLSLSKQDFIQFNQQGNAAGYNGTFEFRYSGHLTTLNRKVILSPTGRVREE